MGVLLYDQLQHFIEILSLTVIWISPKEKHNFILNQITLQISAIRFYGSNQAINFKSMILMSMSGVIMVPTKTLDLYLT